MRCVPVVAVEHEETHWYNDGMLVNYHLEI